jgi:uncharacterized membrane protein
LRARTATTTWRTLPPRVFFLLLSHAYSHIPPSTTPTNKNSRAQSSRTVVNNTTVVAPPLVGGFGWGMPFGGYGWGFGPTFLMPFPFMGGLIQMMFLLLIVNVVFSVVKGAVSAAGKADKKDDDWDSL